MKYRLDYSLSVTIRSLTYVVAAMIGVAALDCDDARAGSWSIAPRNTVLLDTAGVGFSVNGMSGVTYLGPSPDVGKHRFWTVQDTGAGVVTFDAEFDLSGNVVSAQAVSNLTLSTNLDFEGIAQVGNTFYLSEEGDPSLRRFDPATGNEFQKISSPQVFQNNVRTNRGFESLAFDIQDSKLWTANEEALTVDGPLATQAAGTTVRLLGISLNCCGRPDQFAYEVEPLHGAAFGSARSGLSELVVLPDGTLIGLERSAAVTSPAFLNRIFEINFAGATNINTSEFSSGLAGKSYSPVGKELLWSGAVGSFGQNLEGLTVGPRLPNGDWILLGVVDNGDSLSDNTIFSLRATPAAPIGFAADTADFDSDFDIDGADLLAWQRGFGVTTLAGLNDGDGNFSGTVNGADLSIWEMQYNASSLKAAQSVPEPTALFLGLVLGLHGLLVRRL